MGRSIFKAALLGCYLCLPLTLCSAQQPSKDKPTELGSRPELRCPYFGTAVHSQLELFLFAAEPSSQSGVNLPKKAGEVLAAEFNLRAGQEIRIWLSGQKELDNALGKFSAIKDWDNDKADEAAEEEALALMALYFDKQHFVSFQEVACQLAGPMVLRLDFYASRFQLNADQRKKIGSMVHNDSENATSSINSLFKRTSPADEAKVCGLARELDNKILALLTEKQRVQWKKQLGQKFDWRRLQED